MAGRKIDWHLRCAVWRAATQISTVYTTKPTEAERKQARESTTAMQPRHSEKGKPESWGKDGKWLLISEALERGELTSKPEHKEPDSCRRIYERAEKALKEDPDTFLAHFGEYLEWLFSRKRRR